MTSNENPIDILRVVWRYPLRWDSIFGAAIVHLVLPEGARVVLFGHHQDAGFCVWLEVDPAQEKTVERVFEVVGTGQRVPAGAVHRHSFQMVEDDIPFVWHLYERT